MKNKPLCKPGAEDQQHEESEGEANKDGIWTSAVAYSATERCPICLNFLAKEVGFPESCYHAFCINCILKWSETSTSCPVDRKPFQVVYKIDPVEGCTKIQVKTQRPIETRENCCCSSNQCSSLYCANGKICIRIDANKELVNQNFECHKFEKKRCIVNEEKNKSQTELRLSGQNHCLTSDFFNTCPLNLSGIPFCENSSAEVPEVGEIDLIRQKREELFSLSSPLRRFECNTYLSADIETFILPLAHGLADYTFPLSPFSTRNQDFSKRTCVHSGAQEGTEKKQAASGASNSRGTRKKTVYSSTRRRSTRNSKSEDVNQLPSSPKSSNSDRDTPGCNSSSANVSSSEHSVKNPPKQRKRASKKGSRVRKSLRSAAQTQEEASESEENSANESEQKHDKKPKVGGSVPLVSREDLSDRAQSDGEEPSKQPSEKESQPVGVQSPASPISTNENPSEQPESVSPAMQKGELSIMEDLPSSPASQNEQHSDMEDLPTSPSLKNGQKSKVLPASPASENQHDSGGEDSPGSPVEEKQHHSEGVDSPASEKQHDSEEVGSPASENQHDSEAEDSPASEKQQDSEGEDTPAAKKPYEFKEDSPAADRQLESQGEESLASLSAKDSNESDSPASPGGNLQSKREYSLEPPVSLNEQLSEGEKSLDSPISKNGQHAPFSEDSVMKSEAEQSLVSLTVVKVKQAEVDNSSTTAVSVQAQQFETEARQNLNQTVSEVKNATEPKSAMSEERCISEQKYDNGDKQANGSTLGIGESALKECCGGKGTPPYLPEANEHQCSREIHMNRTEIPPLPEPVLNKTSTRDKVFSIEQQIERTSKSTEAIANSSLVTTGFQGSVKPANVLKERTMQLSVNTENGSASEVTNEQQKIFCEDDNESIPMECESLCSDHNESEIDHPADVKEDENVTSELDTLISEKKDELKPPSTEPKQINDDTIKKESRTRRSRFHSPSTKWSPEKTEVKETPRSRSRSKVRDTPPAKPKSRSRSRERDGDRDRSEQWKGRNRDRRHRRQSRSQSKTRSRSRSGSWSRARNKCTAPDRDEKDCNSPPWKERWSNDNWKGSRGNDRYRRNEQEKPEEIFRSERHVNKDTAEQHPAEKSKNDFPDWVMEKIKSTENRARGANRSRGSPRGSHWEDNQYSSGDSWNKNVCSDWNSPRGFSRGRGSFRGAFGYGDQNENRWNSRPPFSVSSGHESSRFAEHRNYRPKYEQDQFDSAADRSGWSSASSWAVRKTLPADVQNYYSKRGRIATGSQAVWPKQEESQDQDQTLKDQASQQGEGSQIPVNMMPTQMNVMQQQINAPPQPMNIFPYSVGVHPPLVNIQHNPYNIHPQLPMHLHPGVPLVQVSAPTSVPQGLPPPPPPPPPSQQVNYISSQPDGKQPQANPSASHVSNNLSAPLLPAPTAALGNVGSLGTVLGPSSASAASSYSKAPHTSIILAARKESITVEASADSSKKEKKIQIQERAAHEVKVAIKPYYQNKDITKEEYKEIVKKAVDKVCHSKSGEVDSAKVANLVKAYVDKYKHSRKKGPDDKP
ncbi:hypothetical protein FKM82_012668 [Ascaphus truei]